MKREISRAALMMVVALSMAGCGGGKVSKANAEKIKPGMTVEEVEGILGKPTSTTASGKVKIGDSELSGQLSTWQDGDKKITISFANGKVTAVPLTSGF